MIRTFCPSLNGWPGLAMFIWEKRKVKLRCVVEITPPSGSGNDENCAAHIYVFFFFSAQQYTAAPVQTIPTPAYTGNAALRSKLTPLEIHDVPSPDRASFIGVGPCGCAAVCLGWDLRGNTARRLYLT
jgi:hypothetical protein